jgi:hypothetical protein
LEFLLEQALKQVTTMTVSTKASYLLFAGPLRTAYIHRS